jgi:creatinine amidohydrolase
MMRALLIVLAVLCAAPMTAEAQTPRPPMTPEQQAAAAARRAAEMKAPRPIEALDSVWMEQLTWMEVRDAIAEGKTTALILTGGVESNGPHLATGKHNYVLQVVGESIARKLGNALIAPIVTLEPGRPDAPQVAPGSVFLSRDTYKAVLTDMALSLRGMGFTNIVLIGDSGGNQAPMKEVAAELTARDQGTPARFHYVPEYYDYESVQRFIRAKGIEEGIEFGASYGTDGLHEELGIDAIMMVYDPETVRIEQRTKANRATINGVSLLPVEKTVALGKEIVELRANNTVAAIRKALAAPR